MVFRILVTAVIAMCPTFCLAQEFSVNGSFPYRNMANAPTGTTIQLHFTETVEASLAGKVLVYDQNGRRIPGYKTVEGSLVTFFPYRDFPSGQNITVAALDFKNSTGTLVSIPYIYSFNTVTSASPVSPPKVKASSIPQAGDQFARFLQAVDFDGDGDVDIVSSTRWLENTGLETFSVHMFANSPYYFDMKVYDLDDDGDMDMIGSTYNSILWMKNDGEMNFDVVNITSSGNATSLSIGDVNVDNIPDILITENDGHQPKGVSWLIGNGDGTFTREVVTSNFMANAVVADINLDSYPDVIASDEKSLYWFYNYGSGWNHRKIFTTDAQYLNSFALVDIDNDHRFDIVTSEGKTVSLVQFQSDGITFSPRVIDVSSYSDFGQLSIGDFDGDGNQDIITNSDYGLFQYRNQGNGQFERLQIVNFSEPVDDHILFDVDRDGDLDIVYKLYYGEIGWAKNTTLSEALPFQSVFPSNLLSENMNAAAWADVDLDNDQDLFVSGYFDGAWGWRVYENQYGSWRIKQQSTGHVISSCFWFDYENDGDPDLLVSGVTDPYTSGQQLTQIYTNNNGTLELLEQSNSFPEGTGGEVAAADLDNDGKADIIILGNKGGVYTEESGQFVKVTDLGPMPHQNARIALADVDMDGDLDIAMTGWLGNDDVGTLGTLAINDGDFRFRRIENAFRGLTSGKLLFNDYDSDGDPDLAVLGTIRSGGSNLSSGSIYLNDRGTFTIRAKSPSEPGINVSYDGAGVFGDFTGDGHPDLLTHYGTGGMLYLWANKQNSGWFEKYDVGFANIPYSASLLSAVDFDMDYDLDFLCDQSLYRNNASNVNQRPTPPVILQDSVRNNILYLYWNNGEDAETPTSGLSYRIHAGSQPGKQNFVSSLANLSSGIARVQEHGLIGKVRQLKIKSTDPVYWAVQSVDASHAASLFSAPKTSTPIYLEGEAKSCTATVQKYRAYPSGSYSWKVWGGEVVSSGPDEIEIIWSNEGSGIVEVTNGVKRNTLDVIIVTKPEPVISGPMQVCSGSTDNIYVTPAVNGHSYRWTTSGGEFLRSPNDAQTFLRWTEGGVGDLTVFETSKDAICIVERKLAIEIAATPTPTVTGQQLVCSGTAEVAYEFEPADHNIVHWKVLGGEITDEDRGKITVRWFDQSLGRVTVTEGTGACEGIDIMEISLIEITAPDINGPFVSCDASVPVTYTVTDDADYSHHWTVEGGTIVSSPTSAVVQVQWKSSGIGRVFVSRKDQICERSDSVVVNIFPPIAPPEIDVLSANTLTASHGTAYQWYLDGLELEGETNKTINPELPGNYSVAITDSKGCVASSSQLPYPITGAEELPDREISVYPVPVHDNLVLQISNAYRGPINVQVCDVLGKTVQRATFNKREHTVSHEIVLNALHDSFLILDIRGDGFLIRKKIVVE